MKTSLLTIIFSGFLSVSAFAQVASLEAPSDETLSFQRKQIQALTAKVNTLQSDILRLQSETVQTVEVSAPAPAPSVNTEAFDAQIRMLNDKNSDLQSALSDANRIKSNQTTMIATNENKIAALQTEIATLKMQLKLLTVQNTEFQEKIQAATKADADQIAFAKATEAEIKSLNSKLQGQVSAYESRINEREAKIKSLEAERAGLEAKSKQLENEKSEVIKRAKDLEGVAKRIQDEKNSSESRYKSELLSAFEENKKIKTQMQAKIDTLNAKIISQKPMSDELGKLRTELTDAKKTVMAKDTQYNALIERHNETQAKADSLTVRNEMNQLADVKRAKNSEFLKAQLEAAQTSVKKFKYDFGSYLESMIHGMEDRFDKNRGSRSVDFLRSQWQASIAELKDFNSNFNVSLESLLSNLQTSGSESQ